jgi:toxin ParE1/3/4
VRSCKLTARAEEDLIEIWLYVAEDNPKAADAVLAKIEEGFARLALNPEIGPARPDIAADLRYLVVGRHLVLYRLLGAEVEVVRVVHAARHLPGLV